MNVSWGRCRNVYSGPLVISSALSVISLDEDSVGAPPSAVQDTFHAGPGAGARPALLKENKAIVSSRVKENNNILFPTRAKTTPCIQYNIVVTKRKNRRTTWKIHMYVYMKVECNSQTPLMVDPQHRVWTGTIHATLWPKTVMKRNCQL
jgi:hypothetical protein